jgi:hypothetical protein
MKTKTPVLIQSTPADPTLPKVAITIGGKEYFLAWDFNALAKGDELLGENLLLSLDFEKISAKRLRTLFYLALLKFQPDMTEERAGELGGQANATQIMRAIVSAYRGSHSEPEAEPAGEKGPNAGTPEQSS